MGPRDPFGPFGIAIADGIEQALMIAQRGAAGGLAGPSRRAGRSRPRTRAPTRSTQSAPITRIIGSLPQRDTSSASWNRRAFGTNWATSSRALSGRPIPAWIRDDLGTAIGAFGAHRRAQIGSRHQGTADIRQVADRDCSTMLIMWRCAAPTVGGTTAPPTLPRRTEIRPSVPKGGWPPALVGDAELAEQALLTRQQYVALLSRPTGCRHAGGRRPARPPWGRPMHRHPSVCCTGFPAEVQDSARIVTVWSIGTRGRRFGGE